MEGCSEADEVCVGVGLRSGDGAGAGLYFTGDSLERNSWREGSRSRRGSVEEEEEPNPNQPMFKGIFGFFCRVSSIACI